MDKCWVCGNRLQRANTMFCSKRCRYKYYHSGPLILPITKKWFDMVMAGDKTEEYRIMKMYWEKRFRNYFGQHYDFSTETPAVVWNTTKKPIIFRNGYGSDKPEFIAECTISEGTGKEEWGAEKGIRYYILTIHEIYGKKTS